MFPEINFYRRYIDDGLGAWLKEPTNSEAQDTARWLAFQDAINGYGSLHEFFINDTRYHPLRWTFEDRSKTTIFLELIIASKQRSMRRNSTFISISRLTPAIHPEY